MNKTEKIELIELFNNVETSHFGIRRLKIILEKYCNISYNEDLDTFIGFSVFLSFKNLDYEDAIFIFLNTYSELIKVKNLINRINRGLNNTNSKNTGLIYYDITQIRRNKNYIATDKINSVEELMSCFRDNTNSIILIDHRRPRKSAMYSHTILFNKCVYNVCNMILSGKMYKAKRIND